VFGREGFGRARLEDVAAEVDINRASLYYYYVGTKEELLIALIEAPAREMTRHCREALESDQPADLKLRLASSRFIEDLENHPELFLLFSESNHITAIPEANGVISNAEDYRHTLLAIVQEGVATGVFRHDVDPRLVMLGILGMHNWIHQWYVPGGRRSLAGRWPALEGVSDRFATVGDDLLGSHVRGIGLRAIPCHRATEVVDDDARTARRKQKCILAAQSPSRPGDHGDLSVEPHLGHSGHVSERCGRRSGTAGGSRRGVGVVRASSIRAT
jgi:AcrR family transcriptional regulator